MAGDGFGECEFGNDLEDYNEDDAACPDGVQGALALLPCNPGQYKIKKCFGRNVSATTEICKSCPQRFYQSNYNKCTVCRACSKCGPNEQIKEVCTDETDTVCETIIPDPTTPRPTGTTTATTKTTPRQTTQPVSLPASATVAATNVVTLRTKRDEFSTPRPTGTTAAKTKTTSLQKRLPVNLSTTTAVAATNVVFLSTKHDLFRTTKSQTAGLIPDSGISSNEGTSNEMNVITASLATAIAALFALFVIACFAAVHYRRKYKDSSAELRALRKKARRKPDGPPGLVENGHNVNCIGGDEMGGMDEMHVEQEHAPLQRKAEAAPDAKCFILLDRPPGNGTTSGPPRKKNPVCKYFRKLGHYKVKQERKSFHGPGNALEKSGFMGTTGSSVAAAEPPHSSTEEGGEFDGPCCSIDLLLSDKVEQDRDDQLGEDTPSPRGPAALACPQLNGQCQSDASGGAREEQKGSQGAAGGDGAQETGFHSQTQEADEGQLGASAVRKPEGGAQQGGDGQAPSSENLVGGTDASTGHHPNNPSHNAEDNNQKGKDKPKPDDVVSQQFMLAIPEEVAFEGVRRLCQKMELPEKDIRNLKNDFPHCPSESFGFQLLLAVRNRLGQKMTYRTVIYNLKTVNRFAADKLCEDYQLQL